MRKLAEGFRSKKWFILLFIVAFIVLTTSVYFIGKKLDKPPTKLEPVTLIQNENFQYLIDFETFNHINANSILAKDKAFSGKTSGYTGKNNPYGPAIIIPIPSNDSSEISEVKVKCWLNSNTNLINSTLVFSIIDQNNNQVHWKGYNIFGDNFQADNWYSFNNSFVMPKEFVNSAYSIKVYLWNRDESGNTVHIDDVFISFKDIENEEGPRTKLIDFEDVNRKKLSSKYAKSGFYSTYAKGKDDFSESIIIPLSEFDISNIHSISFSFNYLSETSDLDAVLVLSICDSLNKDLLWHGVDLSKATFKEKTWETANSSVIIPPEIVKKGNVLKIYLWNRNTNQVYLDDVYLVIKESNMSNDSVLPAFNMMEEKKFQPRSNHPPYDIKYIFCRSFKEKSANILNKLFTSNSRILVDKFDASLSKDQIFYSNLNDYGMVIFENNDIKITKQNFDHNPGKNATFFADEGYLFSTFVEAEQINMYKYDKTTELFKLQREIDFKNTGKISSILLNPDNSVSIFESNGLISTISDKNIIVSTVKFINPQNSNSKAIKAKFFDKNKEVLIIYLENKLNKYIFLCYDINSKNWKKSPNHNNASIQSVDELDFVSEYYIFNDDNSKQNKLLQFNRSSRFELKVIGFDLITYRILNNLEFRNYPIKQNPKYYEYSKIVCGDFCGDNRSEIIIFQDNINRVEWLTQKTEIYSFNE